MDTYYAGTSNIVLPVGNKSEFPPAYQHHSRLTYYASLFNSVEINSSFYKLPMAKTVAKWSAEVPVDFRFTFKVWKELTHGPASVGRDINRFMDVVNACSKKGCLLVQFPPKSAINLIRLEQLLAGMDGEWRIAAEFRHRSWYREETYALLDNYHAGMVLHDLPASAPPMRETAADFIYLRFHGPQSGYRGSYTDDFLNEYSTYINEWRTNGKTIFVYFNNTLGAAVKNLQTLNHMVYAFDNSGSEK